MGRLFVVAAGLVLAVLALHAVSALALPPPVLHCGTLPRRVPLRPARLETFGYPPPSCRTARRVMRRFRRTFAYDVLGWQCTASYTDDDGSFVLGTCTRKRQTIVAYVPGPDRSA